MLQKIKISNSNPLVDDWKITITEFELKQDDFHQTPPDAEENLVKKYILSYSPVVAALNIVFHCGDYTREEVFPRADKLPGLVNIFKRVRNRKDAETEAQVILNNFYEESWTINDILCHCLTKAEDEERIRRFSVSSNQRRVEDNLLKDVANSDS